jgi:hypothetical protein
MRLALGCIALLVACLAASIVQAQPLLDVSCFENAPIVLKDALTVSEGTTGSIVVTGTVYVDTTGGISQTPAGVITGIQTFTAGISTCYDSVWTTVLDGTTTIRSYGDTAADLVAWTTADLANFLAAGNRGTGSRNVYNIDGADLHAITGSFTISGGPSDVYIFVFDGTRGVSFSAVAITLSGGITWNNIIWVNPATPGGTTGSTPTDNFLLMDSTLSGTFISGDVWFDNSNTEGTMVAPRGFVRTYGGGTSSTATPVSTADCSTLVGSTACNAEATCIYDAIAEVCRTRTTVPCYATHGTNATSCNLDAANCHMESRGPYAMCVDGMGATFAELHQDMPFEVLSYAATGVTTVEAVVRVPIFQTFDTIAHWSFLVGSQADFAGTALHDVEASNTCNSLVATGIGGVQPIEAGDYPMSYASVMSACELPNSAAVLAEMGRLQTWVNAHHVAPWITLNGGATVFSGNASCWRLIFGHINTPATAVAPSSTAMPAGLVSYWNMPLLNFVDWTLHLNMDAVYQSCNAGATGLSYLTGSNPTSVRYTVPVTILQRNSVQQRWSSNIYLSMIETTTDTVQVSTTVMTTVDYGGVDVSIVSISPIIMDGLGESLSSSHALRMVFLVRIPQPSNPDVTELGLIDNGDVTLSSTAWPGITNCYGDDFVGSPTTFASLGCNGTPRVCSYTVTLQTEARTDRADGKSFDQCTVGSAPDLLDRRHIFYMKPKMCTTSSGGNCYTVSDTPIRVVSSFSYPIYPSYTLSEDEDIFALVLPAVDSDIPTYVEDLALLPETNYISSDSLTTIAVVSRRELWTRYVLSILPGDDDLVMESAPLNTPDSDPTAWTQAKDQAALLDGMAYVPRWAAAVGGETRVRPPACATVQEATGDDDARAGYGCDAFTLKGAWLFGQQAGPKIRFTITVNIDKSTFQPQSRRLLSIADQPQSTGSWSAPKRSVQTLRATPAPHRSSRVFSGAESMPMVTASTRRRHAHHSRKSTPAPLNIHSNRARSLRLAGYNVTDTSAVSSHRKRRSAVASPSTPSKSVQGSDSHRPNRNNNNNKRAHHSQTQTHSRMARSSGEEHDSSVLSGQVHVNLVMRSSVMQDGDGQPAACAPPSSLASILDRTSQWSQQFKIILGTSLGVAGLIQILFFRFLLTHWSYTKAKDEAL